MPEVLAPFLELRLADVVDILLVAFLISTAIGWIRRTQSGLVAGGLFIVGAVYLAARALDLQLTAWLLQGFFAIFVVIVVVIFQEDLRQLFERLALWSLGRRGAAPPPTTGPTNVLVQAFTDLARERVGALVILPGRQPIQRHVDGGIELNGRLSMPLLRSIFDPHSPGHDGAVIVEHGRVTRFAAHLPLSKNFEQLHGVGTRHSAALGLAERSDALCVVASEERGRISVARNGALRQLEGPQALGAELDAFLAPSDERPSRGTLLVRQLRENWVERIGALLLVVGLWYLYVPGGRVRHVTYDVPVSVLNLPGDQTLEKIEPDKVMVTLSGPSRAFYFTNARGLEASVDATLTKLGRRTFAITDADLRLSPGLRLPPGLTVESIEPARVRLSLREAKAASE